MDGLKHCKYCDEHKPYSAFPRNWKLSDGYHNKCTSCSTEYARQRNKKSTLMAKLYGPF